MKYLKKLIKKVREDNLFIYAANISFYAVISLIPFTMVLLGILEYLLPLWDSGVFRAVLPPIPKTLIPLFTEIITEAFSQRTRISLSFSAFSLLFTASRGVNAALRGVRSIYRKGSLGFFRLLFESVLYTILLLASAAAVLILSAYALILKNSRHFPEPVMILFKTPAFFLFFYAVFASLCTVLRQKNRISPSYSRRRFHFPFSCVLFTDFFRIYSAFCQLLRCLRQSFGYYHFVHLDIFFRRNFSFRRRM